MSNCELCKQEICRCFYCKVCKNKFLDDEGCYPAEDTENYYDNIHCEKCDSKKVK